MAQNLIIANVEYSDVPAVDISKVSGGTARFVDTSDANAVAANILTTKSAYVNGVKVNGTMANNGAVSETLTTQGAEYVIPAGYHNGSGIIAAEITDGTLSASAAASGTVIGTTSSSYPITITATAGVADPGYVEDTTTETATITRYVQTETKTATPTTSSQTISPSSNKLLSAVTVNAMPTGTLGAITATKGTVSNHSITVTPKMAAGTAGYNAMSEKTGTAVTVSASELVSGSSTYTANGTYDVTSLASVTVNVGGSANYNVSFVCETGDVTVDCDAVEWCGEPATCCEALVSTQTAPLADIFSSFSVSEATGSLSIEIVDSTVYINIS